MAKASGGGSKKGGGGGTIQAKKPAGLLLMPVARTLPTFPTYTAAALKQLLDRTVDFVNHSLRKSGLEHEAVADHLFRTLYLNSVRLALDPTTPVPPGVKELLERAGASLNLTTHEVKEHVRIGALNQQVRDPSWRNLDWSVKVVLLRLVPDADHLLAFAAGVAFANEANVGLRELEAYVQRQRPQAPHEPGRRRGLTVRAGERFADTGLRLGDPAERTTFVDRLVAIDDPEKQDAFLADLSTTADNLRKTVNEARTKIARARRK